jgi:hypothetical protein
MRSPKLLLILAFSSGASAFPTLIDTVRVPVHSLVYEGVNGTVRTYSGRVLYDLVTGDNDSLQVTLTFESVGTGAAVDVYQTSGDVGATSILTGASGRKQIAFHCHIDGAPAAQYRAKLSIVADQTIVARQVDSLLALMTLDEKISQVHGNAPQDEFVTPSISRLNLPGRPVRAGYHSVTQSQYPLPCIHRLGQYLGHGSGAPHRGGDRQGVPGERAVRGPGAVHQHGAPPGRRPQLRELR